MDFSHISSYLSSDSRSGWREKLLEASFRGVPFKVEEESAGTGRRVETHEYPNRDKPYTEDLGKVTFRPSITAYVVGDDCFDQRDRLIEALNKPGPGTLVQWMIDDGVVSRIDLDIRRTGINELGNSITLRRRDGPVMISFDDLWSAITHGGQ